MMELLRKLELDIATPLRFGVPLAELTTYEIGGPAEALLETANPADITAAVRFCLRTGTPITVLGAGSNVLAPDEGIEGLVLRVFSSSVRPTLSGQVLVTPAAATDETFAFFAAEHGIGGFEFLYDIPGTIGGGIVQNAATSEGEIGHRLIDVAFVNDRGERERRTRDQLFLGYRTSWFKNGWGIITEARFEATPGDNPDALRKRMEALRSTRRGKFPRNCRNCGSVFKRPANDYAGRLIEAAELGGHSVGRAMVSPKHRNFLLNLGGASAQDVRSLVAEVQRVVKMRFGVNLERELIYLEHCPNALQIDQDSPCVE